MPIIILLYLFFVLTAETVDEFDSALSKAAEPKVLRFDKRGTSGKDAVSTGVTSLGDGVFVVRFGRLAIDVMSTTSTRSPSDVPFMLICTLCVTSRHARATTASTSAITAASFALAGTLRRRIGWRTACCIAYP